MAILLNIVKHVVGLGASTTNKRMYHYVVYINTRTKCTMQSLKRPCIEFGGGAKRLGDICVLTLGDNSAFVNPAGQLLLPGGVRLEWIPSA